MQSSLLWQAASIEIFIFIAACAVMLADLFLSISWRTRLHWAVIASLWVAAAASFAAVGNDPIVALHGFYVADGISNAVKGLILAAAAGSLMFSRHALRVNRIFNGDFLALVLFSVLGMLVIASAAHLLSLYLGLELMSLCLYALIAMRRENTSASEAAIKYFVLGALASGLLLYGISMLYGATGKLNIADIAYAIANLDETNTAIRAVLILGVVFTVTGMGFKLGAAPFHMWLPDVYQGAPAPVTLFIAAAPKIAALAMMLRVLPQALPLFVNDWQQMLMVLALMSLAVGNITAIAQTNLKRMLAYSAIAHSGFIVLGVLSGGGGAALFYVAAYALMTIGGFGVIVFLSIGGRERAELADMRGMAQRNWLVATTVAILMLSMAGVPPFVGFIAKLTVLESVISAGFIWLAVGAVLLSVVGAFYYLRIIRLMFFESAPASDNKAIVLRPSATLLLAAIAILVVWYGLFPGDLLTFFELAASTI
ncbi:MAG: NADH-quinone oxidoreductase subunit NuoN [Proteobacteria bacterium]|nr:NADH-quinone oxidoreductase subunit NuoN [Pseudomonadota bacterium]